MQDRIVKVGEALLTRVTSAAAAKDRHVSRASKGVLLVALLAGMVICVRQLALGNETAWTPFLSASGARFVCQALTIVMRR